jgi:hypothetical protein
MCNNEYHYNRGLASGKAHFERTVEGAGANPPRSGYSYNSDENEAWSAGYAKGWSTAKQEHKNAVEAYHSEQA